MYWIHGSLGDDEVEPETREFLDESLAHWEQHGFGVYMMTLRETGEFAGRVAIRHIEIAGHHEVELAWMLPSGMWGRGLATEAARALLVIAFERLHLPDVVAFTRSYNTRSRRVMEKIGMHLELEFDHEDEPQVLYRLTAEDTRGADGRCCARSPAARRAMPSSFARRLPAAARGCLLKHARGYNLRRS